MRSAWALLLACLPAVVWAAEAPVRVEFIEPAKFTDIRDSRSLRVNPERNQHLKSADFFDSEQHPWITFTSTRLDGDPRAAEGARFRVFGDLTIRDTTMPIALDCMFEGRGNDPWGKERAGFSCYTEIDRRDWGLKWNQAIETGGVLVANKVRIDAEVQFVRRAP